MYSSEEQDFPENNLITAEHVGGNRFSSEQIASAWFKNSAGAVLSGIRTPPEQPHFTFTEMVL
jgi:hypothetical protein